MTQEPRGRPVTVVGATTEQNTANLVPVVQMEAGRYLAVESARAAQAGWGAGTRKVLAARGVRCETLLLPDGREGSVVAVRGAVAAELLRRGSADAPVIWLLGGGLKTQQAALFDLFAERCRRGLPDRGVYSDPGRGRSLVLSWDGREGWCEEERPTQADLQIEEIVTCFNLELQGGEPLPAPDAGAAEYHRFRTDKAYRTDWYRRIQRSRTAVASGVHPSPAELHQQFSTKHAREVIEQRILEVLGRPELRRSSLANPNDRRRLPPALRGALFDLNLWTRALDLPEPPPPCTTPIGSFAKFADYFERLVVHRVAERTVEGADAPIVERRAGARIRRAGGPDAAEYDVLLARSDGTLVSLDAKTYTVERKDADARAFNLQGAAGRFARFVFVFPCFPEDFGDGSAPRELAELPFRLQMDGRAFAVVGPSDDDFHLVRADDGGLGVRRVATATPGAVLCRSLESFLQSLQPPSS